MSGVRKTNLGQLEKDRLPKHIAIIMDGNGRWAKKRRLPRTVGHRSGAEALKKIVEFSDALGIKVLTVYAFSTENWKRPKTEVTLLMELVVEYLQREIGTLAEHNVRIAISGAADEVPNPAREAVMQAKEATGKNTGLVLNIAFNYGARDEIVLAARKIAALVKAGECEVENIDAAFFERQLYTRDLPDPDLVIRTSGERRLSNFLLWQIAYSELYFTETLWPDFGKDDLLEALIWYQERQRRYGALSNGDGE